MRIGNLLLAASLLASVGAYATTMQPVERTCPVGGARYPSFEIMSTSSFGLRLDLRRNGPAAFLPYVECPNGFIVFKDEKEFSAEEIAKLTPVVSTSEYQAARKSEVEAYRVVLLRRALGTSEAALRHQLMQAAFEAEAQRPELREKYLALSAAAYRAYLAGHSTQDREWWVAQLRLAEIARQQGHFPEAVAGVEALKTAADPDPIWFRQVASQIRAKATAGEREPADFISPP